MGIQLVSPTDLNAALGAIANAIRAKGDTQESLTFSMPSGGDFSTAIANIPTGATLPQLYSPSVSLSDSTLTIIDSTSNGAFTIKYEIYCGGALETTINKAPTFELSTLGLPTGTYTVTVKAINDNFSPSVASGSVEYIVN